MSAGLSEVQVRHGRQETAPLVPEAGGGGGGAVQPPVQHSQDMNVPTVYNLFARQLLAMFVLTAVCKSIE